LFFADTGITLYLISQLHMNQTWNQVTKN
jgi:hypothetical protein